MSIFNLFNRKPKRLSEGKEYQRKLPLIHIDTFPSGEKLFTYRVEDLHHINYRHYQTISEINAYLEAFGQLPYEWKIAMKEMKESNMNAIDNPKERSKTLVDNVKFIDHFMNSVNGIRDQNTTLEDEMLCMFYVLENEDELKFDLVANEKKKKLFAENPDMRAFFLSRLPKTSDFFKTTSRTDIHSILTKTSAVKDMIARLISLKTPTK